MCRKYHHSGCQEPTFQTEEARLAVTEVVEVVVPRRPPGPQTLKRPLSKVGETPQTPNNTYTFLLRMYLKSKFNTNQQCCCCCCCCFHCYRNGWGGASSEVGWGPKGWKDRVRENQQRRKGIWGQKCRQYQSHRNRVAQIFPRGMFSILRWQLDNIWSNYGGSTSSVHWRKLSLSLLQRSCLGGKYGKSAWVKVVGSVGRSAACRLKTTSENTFTVTPIQRGFTQPLLRFLLSACLYLFCSR